MRTGDWWRPILRRCRAGFSDIIAVRCPKAHSSGLGRAVRGISRELEFASAADRMRRLVPWL